MPTGPDAAGPGSRPVGGKAAIPQEIWAIVVAAFFIAVGFGLIAPVLPLFADQFSVSVTATTIVVSAFPMLRLAWAPAAGGILTRWGEKPTYMTGVLIVAASSAMTAFAGSYWELLVYRGLGGIGSVMFTVSAMAMIVKYAPVLMRGRVSALYGSMFLIGNVIGPILGGLLAGLGIRAPFLIYAGTLVVAVTIVWWMLRGARVRSADGGAAAMPLPPMTLAEAFADPVYRASLASGLANGWANFGIRNALVPLFVAYAISTQSWVAGFIMAAFAAGNAAALPFSARITDNVGRKPAIIWGMIINGVLTAVFGLMGAMIPLAVVSALAGVGAGLMNPGQQAAVADVIGSERSSGQVLAVFQMVQDVGAIVGPVLAGLVADQWGFGWAFALTGLLVTLCVLPWFAADEPLERARRAAEG
ncbi:MAG TPA: MFS transporter [Actinomycetales bacterium]|nr:MFS transporter [Actinomycetales bacterium]